MAPQIFLAAMGCCDIMLDSIGWSGCNSVLDALSRALPVVTLPGETMRSRHAAAMLREIGLDRFVCETTAQYVEVAASLGLDDDARRTAREALSENLRLLNRRSAITALAQHLVDRVAASPPWPTEEQ